MSALIGTGKLLLKHHEVFSLDKSDLGYCDKVLHKLFMKTEEHVYIKHFKVNFGILTTLYICAIPLDESY